MRAWQRPAIAALVAAVATMAPRMAHAEKAAGKPPAKAKAPALDPDAVRALKDMGKYLRDLKTFEVEAQVTDESVLADGEKIQHASEIRALAAKRKRLRVEVSSDRHQRLYLYDGKAFTLVAERLGYYATVPAPDSTRELLGELEDKYGINPPLVDLFRWGDEEGKQLTSAVDVGPSVVDGTTCEHYAFRQRDIDWQIWIQKGEYPLPRKLVITDKTDPALPQHTAVYTWNLAPSFNEASFQFERTPGMNPVELAGALQALPGRKTRKSQKPGGAP